MSSYASDSAVLLFPLLPGQVDALGPGHIPALEGGGPVLGSKPSVPELPHRGHRKNGAGQGEGLLETRPGR